MTSLFSQKDFKTPRYHLNIPFRMQGVPRKVVVTLIAFVFGSHPSKPRGFATLGVQDFAEPQVTHAWVNTNVVIRVTDPCQDSGRRGARNPLVQRHGDPNYRSFISLFTTIFWRKAGFLNENPIIKDFGWQNVCKGPYLQQGWGCSELLGGEGSDYKDLILSLHLFE